MHRDACGDARKRVRIDSRLPQQLAAGGIDRVRVAADVAEERRHLLAPRLRGRSSACCAIPPAPETTSARTRGRIERIEISRIGTDEDPAVDDRRLSVR
jgi:hypothetical protein